MKRVRKEEVPARRKIGRSWLAASLLALAVAGCKETPVEPELARPPEVTGTTESSKVLRILAVECVGDRRAEKLTCGKPQVPAGLAADIIVGNQGVYVTLTSSNVNYNGGTGQFTFDVTLQNMIEQPMGTSDGEVADPAGIRVFFASGPTVTGGTGVASVVPDGFGTFTAAGQPYYTYPYVLNTSQVSPAETWTLIMPPTVTTFAFTVFVSTPVEYPVGYITLDGNLPGEDYGPLHPGTVEALTAVVKTSVGNVVADPVTFNTTDAACATVSPTGDVTGVRAATCSITAQAGARSGELVFQVTGAVRNWDGSTSSDWTDATNWADNLVPADVDSVVIPTGVPNFPALVGNTNIGGVDVADGATLSLGAFNLTVSANILTGPTAGSGILATTGILQLAGTNGTIHGRVPQFLATGTYSLSGDLFVVAPGEVELGEIQCQSFELTIQAQ